MNNKMKTIVPAVLFAAFTSTSALAASNDSAAQPLEKVAPYPKAEKGMKRQVIQLTPEKDESTLKVELLIGQTLEVDCNQHRLVANWTAKRWKVGDMTTTSSTKSHLRFQP